MRNIDTESKGINMSYLQDASGMMWPDFIEWLKTDKFKGEFISVKEGMDVSGAIDCITMFIFEDGEVYTYYTYFNEFRSLESMGESPCAVEWHCKL